MKKILYLLSVVLFVGCTSSKEQVEELLTDISTRTDFNGLIHIEHNTETLYSGDLSSSTISATSLENHSRIYLASLTKLFTEIVVLKLEGDGKLNLNNSMSQYRVKFQPNYGNCNASKLT